MASRLSEWRAQWQARLRPLLLRLGIRPGQTWIVFAWLGGCLALLLLVVASIVVAGTPRVELRQPRPSRIYSADSVLLATLAPPDYEPPVPYDSLPKHVVGALLAAESPGYRSQGWRVSSPFSRLLVRQLDLPLGKALRRFKLQYAAFRLEHKYPKDTLLSAVLGRADFGQGQVGLVRAARFYFDKTPLELAPQESAMLMGLLEAPTTYSPNLNPDKARMRRNRVLAQMAADGSLTAADVQALQQLPLGLQPGKARPFRADSRLPYFTGYVERWMRRYLDSLARQPEGRRLNLYTDGLSIYTSLDTRLQRHAEDAVYAHLRFLQQPFTDQLGSFAPWRRDTSYLPKAMRRTARYQAMRESGLTEAAIFDFFRREKRPMQVLRLVPERGRADLSFAHRAAHPHVDDTTMTPMDSLKYYAGMLQGALVSLETGSNRLRAWVGGLDYQYLPLDHVYQTRRQVGSAFKPFVYAAALDSNIAPCDELPNAPMRIETPEGIWTPRNSEGESDPKLSLRCALAFSINRVAVHLTERLGRQRVADYARRFGVSSPIKPVPAVGLGTSDVSVLEMTGAYATIANLGQRKPVQVVDAVFDADGNPVPLLKVTPRQVFTEQNAYALLDMMRGVVTYGTAGTIKREYNLYGIDLAGKTGTTQNHSDGWFMSVTPELVTGVWVGADDRRVHFEYMYYGRGAMTAMPIGGLFLKLAYGDKSLRLPKNEFRKPKDLKWQLACAACPQFREAEADSTESDSLAVLPALDGVPPEQGESLLDSLLPPPTPERP